MPIGTGKGMSGLAGMSMRQRRVECGVFQEAGATPRGFPKGTVVRWRGARGTDEKLRDSRPAGRLDGERTGVPLVGEPKEGKAKLTRTG